MEFQWLRRLTTRKTPPAPPVPSSSVRSSSAARSTEHLRYPPSDAGLQILAPSSLLDANGDLIKRLRTHAAQEDATFNMRFLRPLERLAAHVNVLPATAAGLFSGEMGLFRAAVECGFFSFQSSDGRIFTGAEGVERRHLLESRWRYLCFLAGLLYPLGRPLERLAVATAEGAVWKRHFSGVTAWAESVGADRVYVSWGSTEDSTALGPGNAAIAILPDIVGGENLQMLEDGATDLVAALYDVVSGNSSTSRIAHQVVAGAWQRIMDREEARRPQAYGRLVVGTHLGPYLVGAIRALVEQGNWKPNASWMKADRHGLYLQWPQAAKDLVDFGRARGYAAWPNDAPTLAALLKAAGIVKEEGAELGTIEIVDESGEIVPALKIANPLAVLDEFDPADYAAGPGKTLESVLAADPLAGAEAAAARAASIDQGSVPVPAPAPVPEPAPAAADKPDSPPEHEEPGAAVADVEGSLVEAPEVSYSDLVPDDIRQDIANSLQVELLGKVVMAWRNKGESSETMRRVDNGAAFSLKYLTTIMRDATTWVDHMAKAGLIYSPKDKPGLRVHKVAFPEGRKPEAPAVILTSLACKRLGL